MIKFSRKLGEALNKNAKNIASISTSANELMDRAKSTQEATSESMQIVQEVSAMAIDINNKKLFSKSFCHFFYIFRYF